jgi:hypothetical protein
MDGDIAGPPPSSIDPRFRPIADGLPASASAAVAPSAANSFSSHHICQRAWRRFVSPSCRSAFRKPIRQFR